VGDSFYIPGGDAASLKAGDEVRLIELYNIKVKDVDISGPRSSISAEIAGEEIKQSMAKIQWVSRSDMVEYRVMIPRQLYIGEEYNTKSLEIVQGFAESYVSFLKPDTKLQFVRFGFCRIDDSHTAIMSHR
jgi:glutamyl-tRNA synthetase